MTKKPEIALVGAGLGGMTAAVALQQRGFDVKIYEQAAELGDIGAGITVGPNATRVLTALGLEDAMQSLASATEHVGTLHHKTGERLAYVKRGADEYLQRYGAVVRHVHRADLHRVLVDALRDHSSLHLGHQLTAVHQNEDGATLSFANGHQATADAVVGCDGIKSPVRDALFETRPPEFTGFVAWRGLVDHRDTPNIGVDPHFASFTAENKLFGRYPVRHGELINYVAVARKPDFRMESWNARADTAEVLAELGDWHSDVVEIINATPAEGCLRWALHTRQPLDNWVQGRVTLLGDAAHPMTPFLGMGAAMAIEDAAVLARSFELSGADWAQALARYEAARIGRANKMHRDSIARGEASLGADPKGRRQAPGAGLDEVYRYDAMAVPL